MGIIRVLPPETSRLIAAGEVIDRPAAALRELLDNAIDAGAGEVSVRIEAGGIGLLSVSDDGRGMDREDLELCVLEHATSKIRSADDLLTARSLGFRGEALASIAAAARLEILSKAESAASAFRLSAAPGAPTAVEAAAGRRGSTVTVQGLFEEFPARKRFLKRPQAEAALCRQVFADKAAAHPALVFRYASGQSAAETFLASDFRGRCAEFHPELPSPLLHELGFSGEGFTGRIVAAGPAYSRTDRRLMQVFVNRRRVQEWSLMQALDYAYADYLPGGAHPAAFLFLEIDPALADFNIHPAKREVRFKDAEAPRRTIVSALRNFLGGLSRRDPGQMLPRLEPELPLPPIESRSEPFRSFDVLGGRAAIIRSEPKTGPSGGLSGSRPSWEDFDAARERPSPLPAAGGAPRGFRYLGRALGPFLVFEKDDALWFLDQHAAHERLLFDELSERPVEVQELLFPESFEPEDEAEDERIGARLGELAEAGFALERDGDAWSVTAAPAALARDAAGALREVASSPGGPGGALRAVRALSACRAAVKDGDELEDEAAEALIERSLALIEPRCPHGRPIWSRLTRAQLYALVRRTV
ncbi:MAG TPA: DNA mismatch repair endonuclease MutL [Rectinemataceae bacterium]|nr:DNA mismatch repair endonuclease MutL [Rectinemataceae bacterium]